MKLTEDKIFEKHSKQCLHCTKNTLLPYEFENTCIACCYNVIKRENELTKIEQKEKGFSNRLEYAEKKTICTCLDGFKNMKLRISMKFSMFYQD